MVKTRSVFKVEISGKVTTHRMIQVWTNLLQKNTYVIPKVITWKSISSPKEEDFLYAIGTIDYISRDEIGRIKGWCVKNFGRCQSKKYPSGIWCYIHDSNDSFFKIHETVFMFKNENDKLMFILNFSGISV